MDEETLQAIHARLLDGDPAATLDLFDHCLAALDVQLRAKWRRSADELRWDAIIDALYNYIDNPQRYDPTRGALHSYLFWSAERDLQNLIAREGRHRRRVPVSLDAVEDRDGGGNDPLVERLADDRSHPDHWLDTVDPEFMAAVIEALPSEADRSVLVLMADGERKTEVFAGVLGIADRPLTEQRRHVKRAKDRIQKRVQREIARRRNG